AVGRPRLVAVLFLQVHEQHCAAALLSSPAMCPTVLSRGVLSAAHPAGAQYLGPRLLRLQRVRRTVRPQLLLASSLSSVSGHGSRAKAEGWWQAGPVQTMVRGCGGPAARGIWCAGDVHGGARHAAWPAASGWSRLDVRPSRRVSDAGLSREHGAS